MFNLTKREKAMRTMELDNSINANNIKMMLPDDAENFIKAIALRINWQPEFVDKLIHSTGMNCDRYPITKFLIRDAISFYGNGEGGDS